MIRPRTGLLLLAVAACLVSLAQPLLADRLPRTVIPKHYRLELTPDLANARFDGEATIDVLLKEPSNRIVMHAKELEFRQASVTMAGRTFPASIALDYPSEQLELSIAETLPAGEAQIRIRYSGILNDQLRGFYLSKTKQRRYATTQMEPTDARRAFPSFDEPEFKATFDIVLIIDEGDTAISNGKIVRDFPGPSPGKHKLTFSRTPKMSTYLVAFAIGDFECISSSADGVPLRLCTTPGKKELARYALSAAEGVLPWLNRYYGRKYPFEKLDIVALPDFEAGAMENTAAIFYRETFLLADASIATEDVKRRIAGTMAHEIAHQWFGDLVTMKWWDDIWLNEGFATWMTEKAVGAWRPEWNQEITEAEATSRSLAADSVSATRPIRSRAETPSEINELFDGIAYGKAAAVLRMVESYVGEEVFRKGVNLYIERNSYGNATSEDFWNAVTEVSQKPVDRIMKSFVVQPGAPLVSAETKCEKGKTIVTLSQKRYFQGKAMFDKASPQSWVVPVCFRLIGKKGSRVECRLLSEPSTTFSLDGCLSTLFLNAGGRGYYVSSHDSGRASLQNASTQKNLRPSERLILLRDEWAMVTVGRRNIGEYLALVEKGVASGDTGVINLSLGSISRIGDTMLTDQNRDQYAAWVRGLLRPLARELGWKASASETDERRTLRASVLRTLGIHGRDPEVVNEAKRLFEVYRKNPGEADPTLIEVLFSLSSRDATAEIYDEVLEAARKSTSPYEYYRYLYALTWFETPALQERTLALALSDELRSQDSANFLAAMLRRPVSRDRAWKFITKNWDAVSARLTTWSGATLVEASVSFCDAAAKSEVEKFFGAKKILSSERPLRESLERIDLCSSLKTLQQQNLTDWLGKKG